MWEPFVTTGEAIQMKEPFLLEKYCKRVVSGTILENFKLLFLHQVICILYKSSRLGNIEMFYIMQYWTFFTHAFKVNIIKYSLLSAIHQEQIYKLSIIMPYYRSRIWKFVITDKILDWTVSSLWLLLLQHAKQGKQNVYITLVTSDASTGWKWPSWSHMGDLWSV
jgi:hypothetical protein